MAPVECTPVLSVDATKRVDAMRIAVTHKDLVGRLAHSHADTASKACRRLQEACRRPVSQSEAHDGEVRLVGDQEFLLPTVDRHGAWLCQMALADHTGEAHLVLASPNVECLHARIAVVAHINHPAVHGKPTRMTELSRLLSAASKAAPAAVAQYMAAMRSTVSHNDGSATSDCLVRPAEACLARLFVVQQDGVTQQCALIGTRRKFVTARRCV